MSKTTNVYRNSQRVGSFEGVPSKAKCKAWLETEFIGTHMGEWIKRSYGFEYATTVGRYYQFRVADEYGFEGGGKP